MNKTITGQIDRCLFRGSGGLWEVELTNGNSIIGWCTNILKEGDTVQIKKGKTGRIFPINNEIKRMKNDE